MYVPGTVLNTLHILPYLIFIYFHVLSIDFILILQTRELRHRELEGVRSGIQARVLLLQPGCLTSRLSCCSINSHPSHLKDFILSKNS